MFEKKLILVQELWLANYEQHITSNKIFQDSTSSALLFFTFTCEFAPKGYYN